MDWKALAAPFTDDDLEWRIQTVGEGDHGLYARIVPYVTARAIFDRLDSVVGPANWQAELRELKIGDKSGLFGGIGIRDDDSQAPTLVANWIWKWDVSDAPPERPGQQPMSVKGAASGAYKRAAVLWGMGRDLYAIGGTYAVISEKGTQRWRGEYKNAQGQKVRGNFKWSPPKLQTPSVTGGSQKATLQPQHAVAPAGEPRPGAASSSSPAYFTDRNAPTEKQAAFLTRLMGSHVFTDEEKDRVRNWITTKATRVTIREMIDWAKGTMEKRKLAEAASAR